MAGATPSIVSKAQINQAAGNNPALQQMLSQLADAANTQATKTNTSGKQAPNQSTATVSFQSPFYELNFTDPGGATAASPQQAAQQAALGSLGSNPTQSVVYHQVQAATSVLFDAASSLTAFGGDTGSLQTQFLMALDSTRQWYFRIRTSYDGQTWNQWKNVNNSGLKANANGVVKTGITGGYYAALTLPGSQTVGFGMGQVPSGTVISTASGILLSTSIGIAGAGSMNDTGLQAIGIQQSTIAANGVATVLYRAADNTAAPWTGNANYLTFGWDANGNQNLALQTLGDGGKWIVCTVAGGARFAIGVGVSTPGQAITFPSGFGAANCMAICTPATVVPPNGHDAHGIKQSNVVISGGSATPTVLYGDGSGNTWQGNANWFAIAWEPSLQSKVAPVSGGQYLMLPTPSGIIAIGQGSLGSGAPLPLPPGGYTYDQCAAFGSIDGFNDTGTYMHGVVAASCDVGSSTSTGSCYAIYSNGQAQWTGNLQWFAVAWLS